jgi:hypothetical protein
MYFLMFEQRAVSDHRFKFGTSIKVMLTPFLLIIAHWAAGSGGELPHVLQLFERAIHDGVLADTCRTDQCEQQTGVEWGLSQEIILVV